MRFAEEYDAAKRREAAIDFEDLQLHARDLLRDDPRLREEIQLRFRLPLYHESHMFDAIASVVNATVTAGNKVTVHTKFTNLSDVERRAIQQFVRDLRYLKGELSD